MEGRRATAQEGGQPTSHVWVSVCGEEVFEEESVIHSIEGLRQVSGGHDGSKWGLPLIKALGDHGGEGKEGGYG